MSFAFFVQTASGWGINMSGHCFSFRACCCFTEPIEREKAKPLETKHTLGTALTTKDKQLSTGFIQIQGTWDEKKEKTFVHKRQNLQSCPDSFKIWAVWASTDICKTDWIQSLSPETPGHNQQLILNTDPSLHEITESPPAPSFHWAPAIRHNLGHTTLQTWSHLACSHCNTTDVVFHPSTHWSGASIKQFMKCNTASATTEHQTAIWSRNMEHVFPSWSQQWLSSRSAPYWLQHVSPPARGGDLPEPLSERDVLDFSPHHSHKWRTEWFQFQALLLDKFPQNITEPVASVRTVLLCLSCGKLISFIWWFTSNVVNR